MPGTSAPVACAYADCSSYERVPCLAALTLPRVAERLSGSGGLHLVHARCEECPRKPAAPAVKTLLRRAALLAAALGLGAAAVSVSTAPARPPWAMPSSPRGGLSRRGLLGLFRPRPFDSGPAAQRERSMVLDALQRQRATLPAEAGVAFRFQAPSGCDGCAACARLCPASALKMVTGDTGDRTLTFAVGLCNGCRLCVDVCGPPGARLEPVEVPVGGLRTPTPPSEVAKLRRKTCQRCEADFFAPAAAAGVDVCFGCAASSQRENGGDIA